MFCFFNVGHLGGLLLHPLTGSFNFGPTKRPFGNYFYLLEDFLSKSKLRNFFVCTYIYIIHRSFIAGTLSDLEKHFVSGGCFDTNLI